jgi:uncharacterized protein
MWLNLAAAQAKLVGGRNIAGEARDNIAAKMSPAQIAEAQRLAREWKPKSERPDRSERALNAVEG